MPPFPMVISRVEEATLPFGVGMNYNLEFDSGHRLLLLMAAPPGELEAVWALRLGDDLPPYGKQHGLTRLCWHIHHARI